MNRAQTSLEANCLLSVFRIQGEIHSWQPCSQPPPPPSTLLTRPVAGGHDPCYYKSLTPSSTRGHDLSYDLQVIDENVGPPDIHCWHPHLFNAAIFGGIPFQKLVYPSLKIEREHLAKFRDGNETFKVSRIIKIV